MDENGHHIAPTLTRVLLNADETCLANGYGFIDLCLLVTSFLRTA
jgi:hypothetical protein